MPKSAPRREIVLVTPGLSRDGGGRALAGRLLAAGARRHAASRDLAFRTLSLEDFSGPFGARAARLAAALWREQLTGRSAVYLFDHLGPARAQGRIPHQRRAPYLVLLLGVEVWQPLTGGRRRALERATVTPAISAYTARRVRRDNPWLTPPPVLPLTLEPSDHHTVDTETDARVLDAVGHGFVLTVGRLSERERYKGHDELLALWPRLVRHRSDARLVVVGEGDDRPRLEAEAARRGLGPDRVLFTGYVEEGTLAALYDRAAVFALPSRGEGFGLVYLEAMRAGLPVVALDGTAAAEIVVDGVTGRLVPPTDGETLKNDLEAALSSLLADPEAAARAGEAGRRRFESEFSFDRFADRLGAHLDRLLDPEAA